MYLQPEHLTAAAFPSRGVKLAQGWEFAEEIPWLDRSSGNNAEKRRNVCSGGAERGVLAGFGLEGTSNTAQFHLHHGQGHRPLCQAAPSPGLGHFRDGSWGSLCVTMAVCLCLLFLG